MNTENNSRTVYQEVELEILTVEVDADEDSGLNEFNNRPQTNSRRYPVEWEQPYTQAHSARRLATGLGWFSIGLGLAEMLMPGRLAELIGIDDKHRFLLPLMGGREIASGIAILSMRQPATAVWSRVAGDVMDLAFLASAYPSRQSDSTRLTIAAVAVAGVTLLDILCPRELSAERD